MEKIFKTFLVLTILLLVSSAHARVLAGLIDRNGSPVHSGDEFTLHVSASVTSDPYGYRYTYDITNDVLSNQPVWRFGFFFQDTYSVITGTANMPWEIPTYPRATGNKYTFSSFFSCDSDLLNPPPLAPNQTLLGYSFVSPYPLGIIKMYAEGVTNYPWYQSAPAVSDEYDLLTPYGPGKIMPVIGPVKPVSPNVTDNYSIVGCAGGICDVQLDITGPQDPYGNVYTYQWTGAFGTALGAKPIVQLAAGNYNVSVSISDPYATLVTAAMPITVIDPNPPAGGNNGNGGQAGNGNTGGGANQGGGNTGGANGGNNGGGTNGNGQGTDGNANPNGDIDHDGIPDDEDDDRDGDGISDDEDDDRDGDGKPNDEDDDPDHAD